ncbi:MAG: glycosyltransferase family 4 protein, partial [Candidatus Dormibacteria bacterium]
VLLCAGRLSREKGFDIALEAFARVWQELPEARLIIAGGGAEQEGLVAQSAALGLQEAVDFHGWVSPPEMPAVLNQATAVVVPSRLEGFGLVALEASLMGRPVIASRVGGLPEALGEQEEAGLLVPPGDPGALATAMLRLLRDPAEARRRGKAGRLRAQREFPPGRHIDGYHALYMRVVKETSSIA